MILSGLLARLAGLGLTGFGLSAADQARASLATLGGAAAAFLTFGLAMLAQLAIGWQWAMPHHPATTSGLALMAAGAVLLLVLGLLAAVPVAWGTATVLLRRGTGRGPRRRLAGPVAFVLAGGTALVTGAHHFQNAWPGTGGTAVHRGLVPAGAAAFSWAGTLSVSSYWAHPAALNAFPAPELAWMVLSPLALLSLVGGSGGDRAQAGVVGPAAVLPGPPGVGRRAGHGLFPGWRRVLGVRAGLRSGRAVPRGRGRRGRARR